MLLILHIIIASLSLVATGYTFLFPSKNKLNISYSLVALTVITGTFLILTQPAHLTQTCITGLVYIGFATIGIIATRHRLATVKDTPQV